MLYLVGGVSRSGKSQLAERVRARLGASWFPLDALKMGLYLGAPSLGVHPDTEDMITADAMWPIVKGLVENLMFHGRPSVVEGVNLRPSTVAGFVAENPDEIRAVFLGYPDLTAAAKAAFVANYANQPKDWLSNKGAAYILPYLETCVSNSRTLRDECAALGLPFFDTGANFEGGLAAAEAALVG
jgi:hypothetical protein